MVLSSQYCPALEYSQLAFNAVEPEPSLNLTDPLSDLAEVRERRRYPAIACHAAGAWDEHDCGVALAQHLTGNGCRLASRT